MQLTQLSALRVRPVSAPARVAGARIAVLPRRTIRMRAETEQKAEQAADKAADTAKEGADQVQQGAQDAANKVEQSLPSGAKGDQGLPDKVDAVGREVSKFTQETSGLNESNTTKPSGSDKPDFTEAMSFSGQVPERANSRLAMLAFVAAAGAEIFTGAPVAAQLKKSPLLIGGTFLIFMAASVIPILRGEDPNKESGPFTVRAELWNGRLAMMGFIALLLTETFKNAPAL